MIIALIALVGIFTAFVSLFSGDGVGLIVGVTLVGVALLGDYLNKKREAS